MKAECRSFPERLTVERKSFPERLAEREDAWAVIRDVEAATAHVEIKTNAAGDRFASNAAGQLALWQTLLQMKGRFLELYDVIEELQEEVKSLRAASGGWRGVWSPVTSYARGQTVSSGGCLWHCNENGTHQKPGAGDDWSMMTKSVR